MSPDPLPSVVLIPPGERQLFLDDVRIASLENLKRTFHQPQKKGAVIKSDPLTGGTLEIRSAPALDPQRKVYKLSSYLTV